MSTNRRLLPCLLASGLSPFKVILLLHDADLKKKENWDEYINWLVDKNIKFRNVFSKRVKQLDFSKKLENIEEIEVGSEAE